MIARPPPSRPAVYLALALAAGVVGAHRDLPAGALSPLLAVLAVTAARGRAGAGAATLALGVLACAAAGFGLGLRSQALADARLAGWLPADGTPVEVEFEGVVLASAEPDRNGARCLTIAGRPSSARGDRPDATVLLRVAPASGRGGDSVDALRRGDRVRVWCRLRVPVPLRNPGQADPRPRLLAKGIDATGSVKSGRLVDRIARGAPAPGRWLDRVKVAARGRLDLALGSRSPARIVVGAMLLGDQAAIGEETWIPLRDSGLVHLLSISGLHVGLLLALVLAALRRTRLGNAGVLLAMIPSLIALVALVGGQPPVLRSALSATLALLGRAIGRRGDPLNTLAVAGLLLVAVRPFYLWDIGFELSFAAAAGILHLAPSWARALPLPRALSVPLSVSSAAYLATAPIAAWHFGRIAPVAILSNLASAGLCGTILASGLLTLVVAGVPVAGELAVRVARLSVEAMLGLAGAAASLPGGALRVPPPDLTLSAAYLLILALAARGTSRLGRLPRLALALAAVAIHLGPPPPLPTGTTTVDVIDVGQGLSVLLRGPDGGFVLVDAGGTAGGRFDAGERVVSPYLARRGCRRLELLVLSHGHDDHAGGAPSVLREVEVGEVVIPAGALADPGLAPAVEQAFVQRVPVLLTYSGASLVRAGIPFHVVHPPRGATLAARNERCLVVRAGAAPSRLLLPADLEASEEEAVLAAPLDLRAEALLVGHHGGRHGTSDPFLDSVRPGVAVVSAGARNRFGHPHPAVLERLRSRGVPVLRTDRDGAIVLRSDPTGWRAGFRRTRSEAE